MKKGGCFCLARSHGAFRGSGAGREVSYVEEHDGSRPGRVSSPRIQILFTHTADTHTRQHQKSRMPSMAKQSRIIRTFFNVQSSLFNFQSSIFNQFSIFSPNAGSSYFRAGRTFPLSGPSCFIVTKLSSPSHCWAEKGPENGA